VPHLERAAAIARLRYAEEEGIGLLERALALLEQAAAGAERDRTELRLLATLGQALMRTRGYGAAEVGRTLARARALSETVAGDPHRYAVLSGSFLHHVVRAEFDVARTIAGECADLGEKTGDAAIVAGGRLALGSALFHLGEMTLADEHLAVVAAATAEAPRPSASYEVGAEPGVFGRAYRSHTRWLLGDPEGAQRFSREAIARAEALSHPFSLAVALAYAAMLHQFRGEPEPTWRRADEAEAQCQKHGFLYYLSWMPILRGWARARLGSVDEGLAEMRAGFAAFLETGARLRAPYYLALMARVALDSGDTAEAVRLVAEGRAAAQRSGECWQDAELARLEKLARRARATAT
jgi:predicted ATPase